VVSGNNSVVNDLVVKFSMDRSPEICDNAKPFLQKAFRIPGTPAAVIITNGRVIRTVPVNIEGLLRLLGSIEVTDTCDSQKFTQPSLLSNIHRVGYRE
jgi:hypothetical protein